MKALALAGLALLGGCSQMLPDPAAEADAKLAYQDLADGKDAALEAMLAPGVRKPSDPQTFAMLRGLIPKGPPTSVTQTNWRAYAGTGGRTMTYEHAYAYPDRTVVVSAVLVPARTPSGWMLSTFHVNAEMAAPAKPAPAAAPAKPPAKT